MKKTNKRDLTKALSQMVSDIDLAKRDKYCEAWIKVYMSYGSTEWRLIVRADSWAELGYKLTGEYDLMRFGK